MKRNVGFKHSLVSITGLVSSFIPHCLVEIEALTKDESKSHLTSGLYKKYVEGSPVLRHSHKVDRSI